MKRNYTNATSTVADFFYGIEIEHSPAHGMGTLFVVGLHTFDEIMVAVEACPGPDVKHIYFGANQSFSPKTADEWRAWEDMIDSVLAADYWATLDMDLKDATELLEGGLTEKRRFIPMISIKLPYIKLFNYNTTIKIDDKGFDATNPGVWCHRLDSLMDINKFTSWDAYEEDKLLK
jgi:hypothetical protein